MAEAPDQEEGVIPVVAEESHEDSSSNWKPNSDFLTMLMAMGIKRNAAEKALFYTGNRSADLAAAYVFDNADDSDLETPLDVAAEVAKLSPSEEERGGYKMVFVVNQELGMGIGKVAAQVSHASIGMYRHLQNSDARYGATLSEWEQSGEKIIALKGANTQRLMDMEQQAQELGLPTYLVEDAGLTQVPEGSRTVLCLFGIEEMVNHVTGKLELL